MNQEIEIEFKNLLLEEEYNRLIKTFALHSEARKHQTNHYFDTKDMDLKEKNSALRIREKGNEFILTLKEPHIEGLLETHQSLSTEEVQLALNEGLIPDGLVKKQIVKLLEKHTITFTYLGYLTTERIEKKLNDGLLVLDKSTYFNVVDYEIELECSKANSGQAFFNDLLDVNKIPRRMTPNKIERFYKEKLLRESERY
ncbi:CYTH domain-containing protein [Evansella sp. AB-P1]|uniref:CYTH domain-containing protein n=1 Tax=Evansella sp. AB-P1 TaxID=3037653 RepID=UPI00241FE791|nr:CYTH domain-containing protein [Evansella sp. AB-P1]MDG5789127.1 CYTH domain-containing protein [Evansella sp. AB-P1]